MPSGTELQQRSLTEVPPKTNSPKPSGFEVHEGNIVPVTTDKLTPEQKKELDLMMQQTQHQFLNSFMETRKGTVVQKYKVLLRIDGELQQVPAATAESGSKGILEGSGDKGDSFQGVQVEDLGPDGNVVQPQFNNFQDRIDYAVQHTLINQSGVLVNTLSNMYFSPHLYFSPGSASTTKWSRREQPQHAGQNVNDDSGTGCYDDDDDSEVAAAEWVRSKKVVPCPWVKSSGKKERFDFDITKADKIFDLLLREKQIQLPAGHIIPSAEELGKRRYCKWHNSGSHSTNDCKVFRQQIQVAIEGGKIKFDDSKKPMKVDGNPFLVNMDCEFFRFCWKEGMRLPSIEDCPECSDIAECSSRSHNRSNRLRQTRVPIHQRLDPVNQDHDQDVEEGRKTQWCPSGIFTKNQKRMVQRLRNRERFREVEQEINHRLKKTKPRQEWRVNYQAAIADDAKADEAKNVG
uniref:Retrotransposon protein, putative, unclassified n=1 Tax=Oryza sativa subsp. japonica TaxID=39947 RepID=Q53J69_ORYSJ|nr:retrotransposon protein, putative, unclassified [Oryza sativa Japonica Group]